jgi:glycosyltransferase involved in cell wall biosynthesis
MTLQREEGSLRIMMLAGMYPPASGGLERAAQITARALQARGHSVAVVTLARPDAPAYELDRGVEVHRITGWNRFLDRFYDDPLRAFAPPVPDPGVVRVLRSLIERFRPDVLHAHDWIFYSAAAASELPLLVSLHDHGLVCVKRTFLYGAAQCAGPGLTKCLSCAREQYGAVKSAALTPALWFGDRWRQKVATYLPVSDAVRAIADEHSRVPSDRFVTVASPLEDDLVALANDGAKPDWLPEGPYAVYAGALAKHKGVDTLLAAWQELDAPAELLVLGIPRADEQYSMPQNGTLITGASRSDVMKAYAHSAFTVVPSVWPEPLANVAREALLCGSPVIASRIGGLPEIIEHGVSGLLVEPGDAAALASAMRELLADPDRRQAMGEHGRQAAQRFTASVVTEQLEHLYRSARTATTSQ